MTDIENPAGKVAGYTAQPDAKVALVNEIKIHEELLLRRIDRMTQNAKDQGVYDARWLAIARTDFQRAYMELNRAIFQPTRIRLPEDET